jgi:hypothetical protein
MKGEGSANMMFGAFVQAARAYAEARRNATVAVR